MRQGARFQGFWYLLAHFEVEVHRNFWFRDMSQNSRVLQRVVCLCGAVGVCGECHGVSNDVSYEVFFCAVSLSGTMRSAVSVLLEETAFGGHASL